MTDSLNLAEALAAQPEQFAAAHRLAATADLTGVPTPERVTDILMVGMGDAGIACDVVAAVARPELAVPVTVVKDYECPAAVGPGTLVFALSYSGDTEETLAVVGAAAATGATVVAVTSGGALARFASESGGVCVPCPVSPTDRTTIMGLVPTVLGVLFRSGFWPGAHDALLAAEAQLVKRRDMSVPDITGAANPARELARRLDRTFPLVYGAGALGAVAAYRWKSAYNESAKAPAFWNAYPELDHNEIVMWGQSGDVTRQLVSIVELRHDFEHPRVAARVEATRIIIEEAVFQTLEVRAAGDGPLAQLLDLIAVGEWVSCYSAFLNDVDPGPVPAVNDLKRALNHGGHSDS